MKISFDTIYKQKITKKNNKQTKKYKQNQNRETKKKIDHETEKKPQN